MKRILAAILAVWMLLTLLPVAALAEGEKTDSNEPGETAEQSEEIAETPVPTAVPTETPVPTAAPTATPVPTAAPTETPVPTVVPTATPVPTVAPLDERVAMGADLTKAQREAIYADFPVSEGQVRELIVTNDEEKACLKGIVPEKKIGSVALSCIYIATLPEGSGLTVDLHNINYCTAEMYIAALKTAGISDARVIVSAPYPVSGTGALTGAYKAYEDLTGTALSSIAKSVGAEELVVTGELAEYIGSEDASEMIAQLKGMLDQTAKMTDAEVREEIDKLAAAYSVTITSDQRSQLLSLVRNLEGLDTGALQDKLVGIAKAAQNVNKATETISRVFDNVKGFFSSVGSFFTKLFGRNS